MRSHGRRLHRPGRGLHRRLGLLSAAFAATCFLALVGAAGPARANDTAVGGTGGGIQPIENSDIRMEAETVQAILYREFAEYRIDFLFDNSGSTRTVRLGFPFANLEESTGTADGEHVTSIAGFRAWQDGRPLAVTAQLLHPGPGDANRTQGYFLHEAVFPPGKSTITVSYLAPPLVSAGSRLPDMGLDPHPEIHSWSANYTYWLHTGAGWRDTIGKAVVRYRLADTFLGWGVGITREQTDGRSEYALTKPADWEQPDAATFQWVFAGFEPVLSPYPLRVFPGDRVDTDELATFLRSTERVTRVEIRSPEEVRREHEAMERAGLWDPALDAPLPTPAVRVDAYVDLVGSFDQWDALGPVTNAIQDRFGGLEYDYGIHLEEPYPYDIRVAFNHPTGPSSPVPFGPRLAAVSLDGEDVYGAGSGPLPRFGIGDRLTLTLENTPRVREVRIAPGDLVRLDGFSRLARPKRIRLTFPDTVVEIELEDEPTLQRYPVDASGDGPVTLEVLETYTGSESKEIAIWRLEFGTEPAPTFAPFARLMTLQPTPSPSAPGSSDPAAATGDIAPAGTAQPTSDDTAEVTAAGDTAPSSQSRTLLLWGSILGLAVGLAGVGAVVWRLRRHADHPPVA